MQEAARSRYNDVLDFDSSSAILKIEWREEDLGFTAHVQPFLSPVGQQMMCANGSPVWGKHITNMPVFFRVSIIRNQVALFYRC